MPLSTSVGSKLLYAGGSGGVPKTGEELIVVDMASPLTMTDAGVVVPSGDAGPRPPDGGPAQGDGGATEGDGGSASDATAVVDGSSPGAHDGGADDGSPERGSDGASDPSESSGCSVGGAQSAGSGLGFFSMGLVGLVLASRRRIFEARRRA